MQCPNRRIYSLFGGPVSLKMLPVLRETYERLPEPIVPIDACVPGCPPQTEDLIDTIAGLQCNIASGR